MRRRIALFALGFALAAGVPVTVWLLSRAQQTAGWAFPFPREPKRPAPAPRIPPNHLPDPEPPFVPVVPFRESAGGSALTVPQPPEGKPLPPVAVPTLQPSQRLGDRKYLGPPGFGTLALSADGKTAAFSAPTYHAELLVWDVAAGREIARVGGSYPLVALSPDGRTLYAGGSSDHFRGNGKLLVWDVRTGKLLRERPVSLFALSADGKTLATVDIHIGTIDHGFNPNAPYVPWRSTLAIWNAADFTLRSAFTYTAFAPASLALSPDGGRAVCFSAGTITAFETKAGKPLWKQELKREDDAAWQSILLVVSPDGTAVAAGNQHLYPDARIVRLLDMATGKARVLVEFVGRAFYSRPQLAGMAFTPDGKVLHAAFDGGTVAVELAAGKPEQPGSKAEYDFFPSSLSPPRFGINGFALSADGKTAVFSGSSGKDACGLRVVDANTREVRFPAKKIEPIAAPFPPVDSFPHPNIPWDQPCSEWQKLPGGRQLHWWPIGPLAIGPDGPQEHKLLGGYKPVSPANVFGYVVTPDAETIITRDMTSAIRDFANDDPRIRFRDDAGKEWASAPGPTQLQLLGRRAMAVSADGRTLAALHPDGGIWLWEVATAKPRLRLDRAGPEDIYRFSFSRDGRYLMSNDYHAQTGLVWDLSGAAGDKKGAPGAAELAALWEALQGEDAAAAYRAIWRLATHPAEAVSFLEGKAKDAPAVADAARLAARPFDRDIVLARRVVEALELAGTSEAAGLIKELAAQPAFAAPAGAALKRLPGK